MKIGFFSGTFNPIHKGHIEVVKAIVASGLVDKVLISVTPKSPFKADQKIVDDCHRQRMVELAINGLENVEMSYLEGTLPQPNYTINTLEALKKNHPEDDFYLIIGADNWWNFDKWKDYEKILSNFHVIVFPRSGYYDPIMDVEKYPNVHFVNGVKSAVSSTEIRKLIYNNDYNSLFLNDDVINYIKDNNLYKD